MVPLDIKVMLHLPAVGKTRRIKDYQVKFLTLFHSPSDMFPGILSDTRILRTNEPVAPQIILAPSGIRGRHIDRNDSLRTPAGGIHGKSPCIRKQVQHGHSRAEIPYHRPGLNMIQEQAGVDTFGQIHGKQKSVLLDLHHQRLIALNLMLLTPLAFLPLVEHHVVSLDV